MNTQTKRSGPIYIHYDDGQIFVTPPDYDNFMIAARRAVEVLQSASAAEDWTRRFFDQFVPAVCDWCFERDDRISSCYILFPAGPSLKVYVVSIGDYDTGLGKEISDLELRFAGEGWSCDIVQLPYHEDEEELRTFFDPDNSILVHGQTKTASGKS